MKKLLLPIFVAAFLLSPAAALAQLNTGGGYRSFGGKVITVVPCTLGWHITIVPAGVFPVSYILPPLTRGGFFGLPRPGRAILGTAYPMPTACATFSIPPLPLPGFVIARVGMGVETGGGAFSPLQIGSLY